jgi:hypothetical protein
MQSFERHRTWPAFLAALCIALSWMCCAQVDGQVQGASGAAAEIENLIQQLDADQFVVRQQASQRLEQLGEAATEPLKNIQRTGTPEQRLRARMILEVISRDSFAGRLGQLQQNPTVGNAERLPVWSRFVQVTKAEQTDAGEAEIAAFIRILQAEPELFAALMKEPRSVSPLLQSRVSELLQSLSQRNGDQLDREFTADSLAAVLLIASDESIRLIGATSTVISTLLLAESDFGRQLEAGAGDQVYRQLAGAWVLRRGIAVQRPLMCAKMYQLPEGPVLARRVLKTSLRGVNGWYAMTLLAAHGDADDLPLLESLFKNTTALFAGKGRVQTDVYRVETGDLALAAAIVIRGQDPRRFGFPDLNPDSEFAFSQGTTGFSTPEARAAARKQYALAFHPADAKAGDDAKDAK